MSNNTMNLPHLTGTMRTSILAAIRAIVSIVLLMTLYYTLPLSGLEDWSATVRLLVSIVVLVLVLAWQIRSIANSKTPTLRAVEAVSISLPLFLLSMATTYVLMSQSNEQSFTEALTRTDALYFAITVFSTVGFGDIAPLTQSARIAVTVQIFLDLLLLGVGLRLVVGAVNVGKKRQQPAE
jgi:voltage-gated potassium channel